MTHIKRQKLISSTQVRGYNTHVLYSTWVDKINFCRLMCIVIGMSFCICLPNFVIIRRIMAGLWRHINFSKCRQYTRKYTSWFKFGDCTHLKGWKSICIPNFGEISQVTAQIKLLLVWKTDGRHIGILFPVLILTYVQSSACHFNLPAKIRGNRATGGGVMTS